MDAPRPVHRHSLPATLFLLAYDAERQRLCQRQQLGYLLRAAALTELILGGCLDERRGRAVVIRDAGRRTRCSPPSCGRSPRTGRGPGRPG